MAQIQTLTNVGAVVSTDLALILRGGANVLGTLGNMVGQNSSAVTITGGTINNTVIGGTTAAAVSGTTGDFSGAVSTATRLKADLVADSYSMTLGGITKGLRVSHTTTETKIEGVDSATYVSTFQPLWIAGSTVSLAIAGTESLSIGATGLITNSAAMQVFGETGLPAATGPMVLGYASAVSTIYGGDGTGYTFQIAKRAGSVTTPMFSIYDATAAATFSGDVLVQDVGLAGVKISSNINSYFDSTDDSLNANIFVTGGSAGDFSSEVGHLVLQARVQGAVYRDIIFAGGLSTSGEILRLSGEGAATFAGTVSAASGMYVGGTAAANLLDDYEEGTWTPGQGTFTTWASPTFSAKYTKVGRQVTLSIQQTGGTITAGGAAKYMTGVPFTSDGQYAGSVSSGDLTDYGKCVVSGTLLFFSDNVGINTVVTITYMTTL